MPARVMSIFVMSICVMSSCVMSVCATSSCVTSSCVMSSCVMSARLMSICLMSICVMAVCVCEWCQAVWCQAVSCQAVWCQPFLMSSCVMSTCVMCVHSYLEGRLHAARRQTRMPGRHQHKIFTSPIGTATRNTIYTQQGAKHECQEDIHRKFSHLLLAQLPRTTFTHSKAPNPQARKTSSQNFRISYWRSYPEHNLHTASGRTRMQGRHQNKIFVSPFGTAARNDVYTQWGAKPACQEDIHAKFSHLLLAQPPGTQFTHSKAPNPHARKTSTQNFHISYWHSYPERNLRAKPACQEDIRTKFSHLLLAQLPGTQFTRSKAPNPHARKTSTQDFRISYWRSYPEHNLHTARRQTRMPGRHPRKIFASPTIGAATPIAVYTQQGAKHACHEDISAKFSAIHTQQAAEPECQEDINTIFSHLLLAQLPGTQFTHSKAPNPTSTQNFRISCWHSYPEHNLHMARRQTRMPGRHQHKIFASPFGAATRNTIYAQQGAKPACQEDIRAKFSHLLLAQLPRKFRHSKAPNPHVRKTSTQIFCISYWHSYPENLGTARRQTRMWGRHQPKFFASPIGTATPNAQFTHSKAPNPHARKTSAQNFRISYYLHSPPEHNLHMASYSQHNLNTARRQTRTPGRHQHKIFTSPIRPPTPRQFTQAAKSACQEDIRATQNTPKRTSEPVQCSKPRACHAKAAAAERSPRCSAPSPTPATQKQRQSSGAQNAPKRTSKPVQCFKPQACHAKAAAERQSPKRAKAYIRPRAMLQTLRLPRRSSGRAAEAKAYIRLRAVLQAPRLPRKSSGRAAEPKTRQSVHQTPCRCTKPHACHAKAAAERRSPKRAKAYIRLRAAVLQVPRLPRKSSGRVAAQRAKAYINGRAVLQAPRLPRKSSSRAAEPKTRQSVHQSPCSALSPRPATQKQRQSGRAQNAPKRTSDPVRCSKSHACHAKAAAERRPKTRQSVHQRPCGAPSPTPATQKQQQSVHQTACNAPSPRPATQQQRQSGGAQNAPKRQSRCHAPSPACRAKAAAERRSPKRAKA